MIDHLLYENLEKFVSKQSLTNNKKKSLSWNNMSANLTTNVPGARESNKNVRIMKNIAQNLYPSNLKKPVPSIDIRLLERKRKKITKSELLAKFTTKLSKLSFNSNNDLVAFKDVYLSKLRLTNGSKLYIQGFRCNNYGVFLYMKLRSSGRQVTLFVRTNTMQREILDVILSSDENEIPTIED